MYAKLLIIVIFATLCGVFVLRFRHEQQVINHQMAMLHLQINHHHQNIWDFQVRVAEQISPELLESRIEQTGMALESYTPTGTKSARPTDRRIARFGN